RKVVEDLRARRLHACARLRVQGSPSDRDEVAPLGDAAREGWRAEPAGRRERGGIEWMEVSCGEMHRRRRIGRGSRSERSGGWGDEDETEEGREPGARSAGAGRGAPHAPRGRAADVREGQRRRETTVETRTHRHELLRGALPPHSGPAVPWDCPL